MLRHPLALALTLALSAAPALASAEDEAPGSTAAPEKHRKQEDLTLRALGGAFDGMGVRRYSGGLAFLQADWKPTLRAESVEVAFPLRLDHRQTFGASLNETIAGAGIDVDFVDGGLRHGPIAGASYTWRPNWPDLYQPDGVGGVLPTDRHSHSRWYAGWQLWDKLGDGRHLRLKAEYVKYDYVRDPNYDPSISVVHLAPRDNGEAKVGASFRQLFAEFGYALRLDAFYRKYDVLLAKKADTGGTSRSDPLASLYGFEPRVEAEYLTKPVKVTLGYGFISETDPFQGYYTNTGHHPYVEAKLRPMGRLSLEAKLSAKLVTYGPDSKSISSDGLGAGTYVQGTEDGKRLYDNRIEARAGARFELTKGLFALAEASWLKRDTNYRDYVPGVFPPTATRRPYDIKWDYTNTMVTGGLEWRP
ncbi:MAG: hypothetical protein WCC48_00505 [Anaeromyxobacteraceae bacterium]